MCFYIKICGFGEVGVGGSQVARDKAVDLALILGHHTSKGAPLAETRNENNGEEAIVLLSKGTGLL